MNTMTLWQPMTPVKGAPIDGPQRYVHWLVAAPTRHEAERMSEQYALQLGIAFEGDIHVARFSPVVVP